MSLIELSALVGVFLPTLVAIVNQPRWPSWVRAVATAAVCIVAGGVTAAASGELTGKRWFEAAVVVFGAALATYHAWWKPSGITNAIEKATAVGGSE
jgi:VIT1/CCC1 family predicted Fe2+/Mn2+ transporter